MSQVVLGEDNLQPRKKWYFNGCLGVDLTNPKLSRLIFSFLHLEQMKFL